jgi:outer membrane lipoprotein LolB
MTTRLAGMTSRLAAMALLASCASAPPPQPLPQLTTAPAAFEMSGRISVRQGDRSDIAKLRWTHKPGADEWVIASPLGNEVARIEATPGRATLRQAGASGIERAPDFEALTERLLGVPLDPRAMAAWLHGASPAGAPSDWKVTIDETQRAGSVDLAKRITASRGDTTVRLVVDEYRALVE